MINIYDSVNKLASDLQQTPEYTALKNSIDAVRKNETSLALFKQLDKLQGEVMQAQSAGKALTEDQQKQMKDLDTKISQDGALQGLLLAEQQVYGLLNDIQKTTSKPITDLYDDLRNA